MSPHFASRLLEASALAHTGSETADVPCGASGGLVLDDDVLVLDGVSPKSVGDAGEGVIGGAGAGLAGARTQSTARRGETREENPREPSPALRGVASHRALPPRARRVGDARDARRVRARARPRTSKRGVRAPELSVE
jgi:hypothetical protein